MSNTESPHMRGSLTVIVVTLSIGPKLVGHGGTNPPRGGFRRATRAPGDARLNQGSSARVRSGNRRRLSKAAGHGTLDREGPS